MTFEIQPLEFTLYWHNHHNHYSPEHRITIERTCSRANPNDLHQSLHANIETIGVIVSGQNLPSSAELMYRQADDSEWKRGHPLMNVEEKHLVGSLFDLTASTTYEVKVTDGETEISGFVTTQPNQLQFTPTRVLYVNADAAPGGDGSVAAPFQTIQAGVNLATPGTQVLVADGIYHEEVNFPTSGTESNWIQVKAAGQNAILEG